MSLSPLPCPQIQHVVKIDIRQQRRDYAAYDLAYFFLWCLSQSSSRWREPRIRINPEHHQNFVLMNFDTFDQAANDLAFRDEIHSTQSVMDRSGKLFETINDEKQLALTHLMTP